MPENNYSPQKERIQVLPPEEARRIAAGEVIDRPAALVREFLDNSIDAAALNIEVSIEEGGCKKVEVSDDGAGINGNDLKLCHLTHATSKIRNLDDLCTSRTLGFRGEALAAVSAVSHLEIITSDDGRQAYKLNMSPGEDNLPVIEQTRRTRGTTVRSLNLFESIPARKKFLKREGSEGTLCRQVFIDKALAFNAVNFRFISDGKLKDFLPAAETKKERFAAALLKTDESVFLHEINVSGDGFSAVIVIGGPEIYRNDRRQLFVFANGRRIHDYSLIQAIEYGAQGWFPNGTHPVGAVYIEINPALADFNIHPAKREVRFKDPGAIHHAVSGGVKAFFHNLYIKNSRRNTETQKEEREGEFSFSYSNKNSNNNKKQNPAEYGNISYKSSANITAAMLANAKAVTASASRFQEKPSQINSVSSEPSYAGRVFGLFILIEWNDKLYIIDQHAAHERILYNKFMEEPIPKQELLSPIPFTTENDGEDSFLELKRGELSRLGIEIEKDGTGWQITALPADWRMGDAATVKEILELRTAGEDMSKRWAASLCCRAAIKDGDYPDNETALALGKEALTLQDPRCPHGRPIWTEISRDALYRAVKRD
jgi:DNA mismatch repair protein MutL